MSLASLSCVCVCVIFSSFLLFLFSCCEQAYDIGLAAAPRGDGGDNGAVPGKESAGGRVLKVAVGSEKGAALVLEETHAREADVVVVHELVEAHNLEGGVRADFKGGGGS